MKFCGCGRLVLWIDFFVIRNVVDFVKLGINFSFNLGSVVKEIDGGVI